MEIHVLIAEALKEDLGEQGDLTTDTLISPKISGSAKVVAKSDGVLCGANIFVQVCRAVDPTIIVMPLLRDGDAFKVGDAVIEMEGAVASILKSERTALNFMGHLSGVASLTRQYVERVKHTKAIILDTRKTTPGLRSLEKFAVYHGGGQNHRRGLWDMVLVKENHLAEWKHPLSELVPTIRQKFPRHPIEVEVQTLNQMQALLDTPPNRIMLDHFSLADMRAAVALIRGHDVQLEASGNVSLGTVKDIAETGVDFISVGALTHSALCSDFSLLIQSPL